MKIVSFPPFLLAYFLAIRENARWTTWVPFLITGCLQVALFILCLYLRYGSSSRNVNGYVAPVVESDGPNERSRLLGPQTNIIV